MRVLYTCNELGLGHVTRSIRLGNELIQRGHEVSFVSGGKAYELLKDKFRDVYYCTPVSWYETLHGVMPLISALNIFLPLPAYDHQHQKVHIKRSSTMETIYRYYDEREVFTQIKADIIISDGDITALRLAQRWKTPSIFITNVIQPNYKFPTLLLFYPGQRLVERYIKKADRIIIPDLPPPHTLCEYNLGHLDHLGIRKKVNFVGPFLNMSRRTGSKELIFASITGPLGSREKLKREIIPVLSTLDQESIVSLGEPYSNFYKKHEKCQIFGWLSEEQRTEYIQKAKLMIIPGSHGTCFETIKYGKPSICIPTQIEQKSNAKKMEDLKVSLCADNKTELRHAIKKIEDKYDFFKKNAEQIGAYTDKLKGVKMATEIIEDTL